MKIKTLKHLVDSFNNRITPCFISENPMTYRQVYHYILDLCRGFLETGLKPGNRVMLISGNRQEWLLTTLALNYAGIIDVPRGEKASDGELNYIIKHSDPSLIIVENEDLYKRVEEHKTRRKIISIEEVEGLEKLSDIRETGRDSRIEIPGVGPNTVASHLYTSGTTGEPKGAELTHGNYVSNAVFSARRIHLKSGEKMLCILPLWHAFERTVEYIMLLTGVSLYYTSILTLSTDLTNVKPEIFVVVPRILELIFDKKVMKKLSQKTPLQQLLFKILLNLSRYSHAKGLNPFRLLGMLPRSFLEKQVFAKLREGFGEKLRLLVSGGGKLRPDIDKFFYTAGLPILEGYGLTETSPVIAVRSPKNFVLGTVGRPLDNLEVKIIDSESGRELKARKRGVITVKGSSVMRGYYKNAYETDKVMKDGWFDTGDLGYLDKKGNLVITGRKKNIIVLSNGENISPEYIEQTLNKSPVITRSIILGQDWKGLGALIEPDYEVLEKLHPQFAGDLDNPKLIRIFKRKIRDQVSPFSGFREFECVKSFRILKEPLAIGKELTATLKLKRRIIEARYSKEIEDIYNEIHGKR